MFNNIQIKINPSTLVRKNGPVHDDFTFNVVVLEGEYYKVFPETAREVFYLQGLTIFLDYPATKIDVWNLPVTADLEDTDFVALPPVSEEQFQIMLHDYFAGRGNAPKDRIANQMDAKQ